MNTANKLKVAEKRIDELESELRYVDDEWEKRFREQAENWHLRTQIIRKQLDTMLEMFAKNQVLQSPRPIIIKRVNENET